MNRAEIRAIMKGNKTNKANFRRGENFNMRGMNVASEGSIVRVREMYMQLEKPFGLKGNVELSDALIEAKYTEIKSSQKINDFVKQIVLIDDFVWAYVKRISRINDLLGLSMIYSESELKENAYLLSSLYIAVAVTIVKENYEEGILQEIITEVQEYELSEDAEDRLDLICTLVMPEEELQVVKTFQALISGNAQSFIDELDKFGAILGIQR